MHSGTFVEFVSLFQNLSLASVCFNFETLPEEKRAASSAKAYDIAQTAFKDES